MKTHIFIASYSNDIPYLILNLRTIRRFASGFSGVTIAVPGDEISLFIDNLADFVDIPRLRLRTYARTKNRALWQIVAQGQKCWADAYCPDADYILHTDSDCIFVEPVTPEEYFQNGKPIMLYESYSRLPPDVPWKKVTEDVLGRNVEYEFMRRHPQVNPKSIYCPFRCAVEAEHKITFDAFIESRKPDFPWGFSEHNAIGAFAYYSPMWQTEYAWRQVSDEGFPKEKLMQFWSHSDIDTPQEISHGGKYRPREYVDKLLK